MSKTYRSEASANQGLARGSRPSGWKQFRDSGYDPRNSADGRPQYSDVIEYQHAVECVPDETDGRLG